MSYDWDFSVLYPYKMALLKGILVTIKVAAVSSSSGIVLGILLGVAFYFFPLRGLTYLANDMLRSIPLLVLLFFFYYFPYKALLGIQPPSAEVCAIIALTTSQAIFTAELVRAGVQGVPKQALLGARSIGLKERDVWLLIILPDVLKGIAPSLMAFSIGILQLSSLASIIGVPDVVYVAKVAAGQQFRSLEAWIVVAVVYAIIVTPMTLAARKLETSKWLKRRY